MKSELTPNNENLEKKTSRTNNTISNETREKLIEMVIENL